MTFRVKYDLLKVHHGVRIEQQIQILQRLRGEVTLHLVLGQQLGFRDVRILSIPELRLALLFDRSEDIVPPLPTHHASPSLLHIDRVLRHRVQHIQRLYHLGPQQIPLPVHTHLHARIIRERYVLRRQPRRRRVVHLVARVATSHRIAMPTPIRARAPNHVMPAGGFARGARPAPTSRPRSRSSAASV